MPRTFPENASFKRSCPAPYKPWALAILVVSTNVSQANLWISALSVPRVWIIRSAISSPVKVTRASLKSPLFMAPATRSLALASIASLGRLCPPMDPVSAFITESVVFISLPPLSATPAYRRGRSANKLLPVISAGMEMFKNERIVGATSASFPIGSMIGCPSNDWSININGTGKVECSVSI